MLSHKIIAEKIRQIAGEFPVKRISYFGSYASGKATENSDLDVLVEFKEKAVSLFVIAEIKYRLEDAFGIKVDVIHAPLPKDSIIEISSEVVVYDAA
jgi:predicted nucleotidyltransferase